MLNVMAAIHSFRWWKEATCYQIWPASFKDSNGDGVGDIPGIISKLDYLKELGVDLIWLSPVYDSPQHDMGYDVRDYENIWPRYGTLRDMESLISAVKSRGMKLIMDLVVNHTSNEHKWFLESRKSTNNPYSDWYIWRNPRSWDSDGNPRPPNNWKAAFGGSAWTYASERNQFYLHLALTEQPDLNWQIESTRKAIYASAIDFWLASGVDGFRVDVVNFYWKDPAFPDAKVVLPNEEYQPMEAKHILNGPQMHFWLQEQRSTALNKYGEDIVMVGELPATDQAEVLNYISPETRELDMVFDFDIFMVGNDYNTPPHEFRLASLPMIKGTLVKTQGLLVEDKGWTTVFLENHDTPRSVSRFGPGEGVHHFAAAKMLAVLVTTLSGTLFLYQGQEIGMSKLPSTGWNREDFRDKAITRYLQEIDRKHPDDEEIKKRAFKGALNFSRDNARTPMQWSDASNAGFTDAASTPWINVNKNYTNINVEAQKRDPDSVLAFWTKMLRLRKQHKETLVYGKFELLDRDNDTTLTFLKSSGGQKVLVLLNFSDHEARFEVPRTMEQRDGGGCELVVSNISQQSRKDDMLLPWEGRVYVVEPVGSMDEGVCVGE